MIEYINVKELSKSYGKNRAISDISFSVQPGEVFTLFGINGAGKTTIVECIEGLRKPDSGEITVYWMDISQNRNNVQRSIGVLLQSISLPNFMTVREAMELYCAWHKVDYSSDLLERFDMGGEYLDKTYASLTQARRRKLHLALALCYKPKVLIVDEPSEGLDTEDRNFLYEEIKRLRADRICILMTTNDMTEAKLVSDKIGIMRKGELVCIGKPEELTEITSGMTEVVPVSNKIDILKKRELSRIEKLNEQTAQEPIRNKVIIKTLEGCLGKEIPSKFGKPEVLHNDYLLFSCIDVIEFMMNILPYIKECGDTLVDIRIERVSTEDRLISASGGENR